MKLHLLQLVAATLLVTASVSYRLPYTVIPSAYQVHLNLTSATLTNTSDQYEGIVIITLRATQEGVNEIKLHAAHDFINITFASIYTADLSNITVDASSDIVTLFVPSGLGTSDTNLTINFTSRLSTQDMYGFYKSSYTTENGAVQYLATTQFQPVYARRAFPCFDEPALKATFEIWITHPQNTHALSNMPGELSITSDTNTDPTLTTTHFPVTPLLSTYLVAFVVSDFTCTQGENIEENAVPYQVCSTAQTNNTRDFALSAGVDLLRSLNNYTNYTYGSLGFPKMDQVAIPDFAAGAMENWGLVTYREGLLLFNDNESANADLQNIGTIIAHEYAHQWWGNLVTMQWWSETFLNEGFATYFQYFTTHEVYPDWELDKQWIWRVQQTIMESDSFLSSPALQANANSDGEVMARFAQVSYSKGGSIFRMVEHIMGPENFVQGLRTYLRNFAFQNTLPDDLWNTLDFQLVGVNRSRLPINRNLSEVMKNWVQNPGLPILEVTQVQWATIVRQEGRFLLSGNDNSSRWYVPISYATASNRDFENTTAKEWLELVGYVEIANLNSQWLVLNNHAGYYRVNYNNLWEPLIVALAAGDFSGIPIPNRASLVDDAFHLARAERINYTRMFEIVDFLRRDVSHHVWAPGIRGFNYLLRRVGYDSQLGRAMSTHILELLNNIYASVPWSNLNRTDHAYTLKQVDVLTLACRLGHSTCVGNATLLFDNFKTTGVRPAQNVRLISYCNALRHSQDSSDWNLLWNDYQQSTLAADRVRIISALGCTQNATQLANYLQLSLDPNSGIRSQDALSVFTAVYSGSSVGIGVAFQFLRGNHELIEERYQSMNALRNMIIGLAETFTTETQLQQLRTFINSGLQGDFNTAANQALQTAEANLAWLQKSWEELHLIHDLDPTIDDPRPSYRLPQTVLPSAYSVHLNLSASALTANSDQYSGFLIITIRATETGVTQVKLHAAHDFINITGAHINNVDIEDWSVDSNFDIVTLNLPGTLSTVNNAALYIQFTSRLSTQDMYGFYKSTYVAPDGQTRYLATTQFQPTYARRVFPCFDEPAFKASFEIYLTYPQDLNALSNMPGVFYDTSDILYDDPTLTTTYFSSTRDMSTYLVAFVVSDFTCTPGENIELDAVPYNVCSTPASNLTRAFAVQAGVSLLRSLNNFTNYTYSSMGFPKMDQVAIPDFSAGAMENWGLVTYRETLLLFDGNESTNSDQQNIATVISHEYAHQWWGNLVTMNWWSETFLNEGFATYFEYFTTHDVYPDWELDKQWVTGVHARVLETDSLASSQALQSAANSDAEVIAKFSTISYLKGGSIFRMVEHVMGTENFVQGLRNYLRAFEFKTTVPDDLWNTLDNQLTGVDRSRLPPGKNLSEVMKGWVENPGYPILEVTQVQYAAIVRQEGRFLISGNDTTARWYVPISYGTATNRDFDNTTAKDWLEMVGYVEIPNLLSQWLLLNNHAGFYRVNYNNLWDSVAAALNASDFSDIPEVNRATVVDDVFHLARAHRINYTRTFEVIEFLRNDVSHHPWTPAISGFNFLLRRVGQESNLGIAMTSHILTLLTGIYGTVGWANLNPTNHAYTLKQVDVLTLACRLGHQDCVNNAQQRFGEFRVTGQRPVQNLRSIVYCNALRYNDGNSSDWQLLWNAYQTSEIASDRVRILSALGCTQNTTLLENYLQMSLDSNSGIRAQDAQSVFTAVFSGNAAGISIAFRFLRDYHTEIEERYTSMGALRNMITGLAERFTTQAEIDELRSFITDGGIEGDFLSASNAALLSAEANLEWFGHHRDHLYQYYGLSPEGETTSQAPSNSTTTTPPSPTPSSSNSISSTLLSIVFSLLMMIWTY